MTVEVGTSLSFDDVVGVAVRGEPVAIARDVGARMSAARKVVEGAVQSGRTIYGITTGFGGLSNIRIHPDEALRLQHDIVRSHATAVGPPLPADVVRAMMLLKARTFAFGHSGVRLELVEALVRLLNEGIHPVVPAQGSLGASGDLALLAHLALPLVGEGEVETHGRRMPAADALRAAGIEPLEPSFKEGLALVNGTEGMLALGILGQVRAESLARVADVAGAMSLEACLGTDRAFDDELVRLRKHAAPPVVAANLRRLLAGSAIVRSHRFSDHLVQDAYSLRCMPQVHGAYRDGLAYVRTTLEAELASAVDNPSVFPDRDELLSGGNFHGEALGLALDHLCLCASGFATIAERRVARLVDPELNNGLPAFLTPDPGRRSGFMLAHYTAASIASENRGLCWPASSDSIPTSAGQEDHVSMGATSARRAAAVVENARRVVAIELLAATQGLELRAPLEPAPGTRAAADEVRSVSSALHDDRSLAPDIEAVASLVAGGAIEHRLEARGVRLD
ncbi:MAG TPA: histidine ammonia-lyase [Actinomycetota bacterium]|nr:histidine ammonia-lyase [Actinomycetota bacterium]